MYLATPLPFIPSPHADQFREVARRGARGEGTGRPVVGARKSFPSDKRKTKPSRGARLQVTQSGGGEVLVEVGGMLVLVDGGG